MPFVSTPLKHQTSLICYDAPLEQSPTERPIVETKMMVKWLCLALTLAVGVARDGPASSLPLASSALAASRLPRRGPPAPPPSTGRAFNDDAVDDDDDDASDNGAGRRRRALDAAFPQELVNAAEHPFGRKCAVAWLVAREVGEVAMPGFGVLADYAGLLARPLTRRVKEKVINRKWRNL